MDRKTAVGKARAFARLARKVVGTSHGYLEALTLLYRLRGRVDVRIEPHLVVESSDPAGFSAEIRRTGIRL